MTKAGNQPLERLQSRRKSWQVMMAVGFALLFIGSIATQLVLLGAALILVGGAGWAVTAIQIRRIRGDPWAYDPELDGPNSPL